MPFIQARARFIHPNTGHTAIDHSPILSVKKNYDLRGEWNYEDLTLEYQAGYAGSSCEILLTTATNTVFSEAAQLKDIIINDPNGVVTATNSRSDSAITVKITSTGRAGLVSFRFPAEFELLIIWNNNEVVNGYPALKGFRSFGSTLINVMIRISYSFEIPVNIPSTLKSVIFGFGVNGGVGSVAFNDPKISNWDVSNLEAKSFEYMFVNCTNFNQDLSGWCVSQVTSPPRYFSLNTALTPANHPVWGTCPNPR